MDCTVWEAEVQYEYLSARFFAYSLHNGHHVFLPPSLYRLHYCGGVYAEGTWQFTPAFSHCSPISFCASPFLFVARQVAAQTPLPRFLERASLIKCRIRCSSKHFIVPYGFCVRAFVLQTICRRGHGRERALLGTTLRTCFRSARSTDKARGRASNRPSCTFAKMRGT